MNSGRRGRAASCAADREIEGGLLQAIVDIRCNHHPAMRAWSESAAEIEPGAGSPRMELLGHLCAIHKEFDFAKLSKGVCGRVECHG